jgi:hypothetical protein
VREASLQQTQGIDQVAQALAQMEKVTQTSAATSEESAAASEQLNAQAETSLESVRRLEALISRTPRRSAHEEPAPVPARAAQAQRATASARPGKQARPAYDGSELAPTGTDGAF